MDEVQTIICPCGEEYIARYHTWIERHDNLGSGEPMGEYEPKDRCPRCKAHPSEGLIVDREDYIPEPPEVHDRRLE